MEQMEKGEAYGTKVYGWAVLNDVQFDLLIYILQPEVFPKNYAVSHYFNDSALCNEPVRMTVQHRPVT